MTAPTQRPLPFVVYFKDDELGTKAMLGVKKYRRIQFENLGDQSPEVERIVFVSQEHFLEANYNVARGPNFRVIALANNRFKDPRLDGIIYSYLPTDTPMALVERMVDNAIDHIHLIVTRRELGEKLAGATHEIHELNQIGAALSAEHDTEALLELILTKSREITLADAGSLYLVENAPEETPEEKAKLKQKMLDSGMQENMLESAKLAAVNTLKMKAMHEDKESANATGKLIAKEELVRKQLRFKLAQNDSVQIPFREHTVEISNRSISGYVAQTGEIVNIADAYHLPPDVPYTINRKFDEDSGYRTKSILAVPMRNQRDEIVGVVQLINAKRKWDVKLLKIADVLNVVTPFASRQQEIIQSLASQAAVALENSRLYEAIQRLFEGFVRASVIAIESRDPTTSGHSFRVANLTVALAEAVDRADSGPYAGIKFTRTEMKEIRYASLLHDFGKVGVREEVLIKAKKLYPSQLDLVKQRFHFVKRTMENQSLRSKLDYVLAKGREQYLKEQGNLDADLAKQLAEVDKHFQTIIESNEPSVLPEGNFDKLVDIAAKHFLDFDGEEKALLTPDEVRLLSIRKGSLDDEERKQIESHVVHTVNFLQQIPWTKEIKNIPAIARGHHEKLNGLGYPYKLSAQEIPVQTRMMTISDIFDALSAADRPYKKAISMERALEILGFAVKDGEIDGPLFDVFKQARVFERWKIEPYPY
jgi:HD-GYP domain-containing protein (c-di-GMP phosphodiesterase class II)